MFTRVFIFFLCANKQKVFPSLFLLFSFIPFLHTHFTHSHYTLHLHLPYTLYIHPKIQTPLLQKGEGDKDSYKVQVHLCMKASILTSNYMSPNLPAKCVCAIFTQAPFVAPGVYKFSFFPFAFAFTCS